jgi:predicted Co/Zn/Cd cation transporter (cation efflux family)
MEMEEEKGRELNPEKEGEKFGKHKSIYEMIPDTSKQKIHTAMDLIGQKYGLVSEEYDTQVVNSADKERAKEIIIIMTYIQYRALANYNLLD